MTFPILVPAMSETPGGNDANTLVLIHCDGADGVTAFTNNGIGGNTVAAVGNAQVDTAIAKFGTGGALLDGAGDYLTISDNAAMDFGTGNFTIDWWEYRTSSSGYSVARTFADTFPAYLFAAGNIWMSSDGANWDIANAVNFGGALLNQWVHRAVVRSGNTFYAFRNGIQTATWSSAASLFAAAAPLAIGAGQGGSFWSGSIDEFRISNVARWTSDFQPRSAAYSENIVAATVLMHMDGTDASTLFTDEKGHTCTAVNNAQIDTAQSVFGGASSLFDGTDDYVQITQAAGDLAFGIGDFTISMRIRRNGVHNERTILTNRRDGVGSAAQFGIKFGPTNNCISVHSGAAIVFDNAANPLSDLTWHMLTFCRADGVLYFGIDGTIISTHTFSNDLSSTENWFIGGNDVFVLSELNGHIDELLMIKGQALYTANFTPPVASYVTV